MVLKIYVGRDSLSLYYRWRFCVVFFHVTRITLNVNPDPGDQSVIFLAPPVLFFSSALTTFYYVGHLFISFILRLPKPEYGLCEGRIFLGGGVRGSGLLSAVFPGPRTVPGIVLQWLKLNKLFATGRNKITWYNCCTTVCIISSVILALKFCVSRCLVYAPWLNKWTNQMFHYYDGK